MATKRAKKPPAPEEAAPPEFDMSDPSSSSYGEGARFLRDMLDPSAHITDEGARVFDWARRVATVDLHPADRAFLGLSRDQLAQAIETLRSPRATEKARETATGLAIIAAFHIGEIKGRISTAIWGRKAWPRAQMDNATKKRVEAQALAIEARRERIRAFCKKRKWPYDMDELAGRLADELGSPDGKKRTRATLRKLYARDLDDLLAIDTTT